MAQTARNDPAPTEPTPPSDDAAFPDLEVPPAEPAPPRRRSRPPSPPSLSPRRTRVMIRHMGIWSVFKFSLLFSFCLMLVGYFALLIIYLGLQAGGVLDSITGSDLISCLVNPAKSTKGRCAPVILDGKAIFTWLFLAGCALTVVWAGLKVFVALIYNLISDVIGGVEVTLTETHRS